MKLKTTILSIMTFLLMITFVACGKQEDSPSKVVKKFYDIIEKGNVDVKDYNKVMTSDTSMTLSLNYNQMRTGFLASMGGFDKINSETINGDAATVSVLFKNGESEDTKLVKENGKWKVKM